VLDDPRGYIAGAGDDNRIYFGVLLELFLIIANLGTALVLIPLLKRQNEILTFSYVAARIMECVFILVGIIAVLAIVTLRQDSPDAGVLAESFAAIKDWTFKLGPGFVVGIGNGLILGYLMYRSGLMPRGLAWLGMVGGPLQSLVPGGHLRGVRRLRRRRAGVQGILTIPEIIWELSLGIYPLIWGLQVVADPLRGGTRRPAARLGGALSPTVPSRAGSLRGPALA
jgi:hypothetical protein